MKEVEPLNKAGPPEAAAYQSIVSPAPAVAAIRTVPVPHLAAPDPPGVPGLAFTVAVTGILADERQPVDVFLASAK